MFHVKGYRYRHEAFPLDYPYGKVELGSHASTVLPTRIVSICQILPHSVLISDLVISGVLDAVLPTHNTARQPLFTPSSQCLDPQLTVPQQSTIQWQQKHHHRPPCTHITTIRSPSPFNDDDLRPRWSTLPPTRYWRSLP